MPPIAHDVLELAYRHGNNGVVSFRSDVVGELKRRGFRDKGARGGCRLDLGDDFALVVDTGPSDKRPDISPAIGIRHDTASALWSTFVNAPPSEYSATIGAQLGYVIAGRPLRFLLPTDLDVPGTVQVPNAAAVVVAIEQGLDALRPYASLDRLLGLYDAVPATRANPNVGYVLAMVAALRSDWAGTERALSAAYDLYCGQSDGVCDQFLMFAANLRRHFSLTNEDR